MAEAGDASGQTPPRRRRRRSSKAAPAPANWLERIRTKAFGQLVFGAMAAVAAAYSLSSYRQVSEASAQYGLVTLGRPVDELTKLLGAPRDVDRQSGSNRYVSEGRQMLVSFDPASRKITGVTCRQQQPTSTYCPKHLGIAVGDSKAKVLHALGPASANPGHAPQMLNFPAIGTSIEFEDETVSAIELSNAGRGPGWWRIVLLRMLP
jgi:hypothetical protein